jgi:hypothetical protein
MNGRLKAARFLIGFGCCVMLASAALHLFAAYPRVSSPALTASNLNAGLQAAFRTVFLMVGWDWIVLAAIVLVAAFTDTRIRKAIVLICGFALLVQTAVTVGFMRWFIGSEMLLAAAFLILSGGLLVPPPDIRGEAPR